MNPSEKLKLLQADVDVFMAARPETTLEALPEWGSLTVLLIIVHFEEKHQLTVTGAEIRACRTVADLLALIP
jgi:acyl carrier protein